MPIKIDTGALKHDAEKPRMELLDTHALEQIAAVMTFGARKYDAHNWRKGFAWSRLLGATLRHVFAYLRGEDTDPESGLSHLAHAGCCIMFLLWHEKYRKELDDRYTSHEVSPGPQVLVPSSLTEEDRAILKDLPEDESIDSILQYRGGRSTKTDNDIEIDRLEAENVRLSRDFRTLEDAFKQGGLSKLGEAIGYRQGTVLAKGAGLCAPSYVNDEQSELSMTKFIDSNGSV